MRKEDLVKAIQGETAGLKQREIESVLDALHRIAKAELKSGGIFEYPRFFKLSVKDYAARNGRNPVTGEQMRVEARRKVKATISKQFSDGVCL